MCGSTDRQVKSAQRNIFIHLDAKQIFLQMCGFHTSNELVRVAFIMFRLHTQLNGFMTPIIFHSQCISLDYPAFLCLALSKEVHSGILSCVYAMHVFCELSSTQARK